MKYSLIGVSLLILTCSCNSLKTKKFLQLSRDTITIEQQLLENKTMLEQRKQDWQETEKGNKKTIEIFADDVFYWHPDSGIQSKKGKLKVRMRLEQSSQQLSLKYSDTTRIKVNGKSVGQIAYTSGSVTASEEVSEKSKDFNRYWKLVVVAVLLLSLLGLAIKMVTR